MVEMDTLQTAQVAGGAGMRSKRKGTVEEPWSEEWIGGSPEAERVQFQRLARDIMGIQLKNQKTASAHAVPHAVDRGFHAKSTLAIEDADLTFLDLPEDLQVEFAQPHASYRAIVRFSNAAGVPAPDFKPDLRGVALRVVASDETSHDLLMTNFPASHARNARQFVELAKAGAGGRVSRLVGLLRLNMLFGPFETIRMLRNIRAGRKHKPASIATETYWSRGAIRWGSTLAVRYLLRPAPDTAPGPAPSTTDPAYLSHEIAQRLSAGDVRFELCIQRYVDAKLTPIEDTAVEWREDVSPPVPVAVLTLSRRDITTTDALERGRVIEGLAFNPWNTTDSFRPLGNLNRARKAVYDTGSAHRLGLQWREDPPLRNVVVGVIARGLFAVLNRVVEWWRLPYRVGILNLDVIRYQLRKRNLIDTEHVEAPPVVRAVPPSPTEDVRVVRTFDGTSNDLSAPKMGAVGATFGRNIKPIFQADRLDEPNPITVSEQLLHRDSFIPARTLNLLAAAWIQFQVHDWVDHARHQLGEADVHVPLPPGRTWSNTADGPPEKVMRIAGNKSHDPDGTPGFQRLFSNAASHWWDGSEVYGSNSAKAQELREGPKLRLTADGYLPSDIKGQEITGFNESWWLGLSGMHTLFAREHNLLCDELRAHYTGWSDDRVYHTARLIVSALIAKIHTTEWTPAILATKTIDVALNTNWSGPPAQDWRTKLGIWLVDSYASAGIPATMPNHHSAPYSLTEDFVTVYRMHPLLPDEYRFGDHRSGELLQQKSFLDIQGDQADEAMRSFGLENTLYSFGIAHPGAIQLHNYPRSLQGLVRNGNERIDLSVVDLVRTRHRGVPRYNDFRVGLHKPRITRWEDLCDNPESVRRLREVYRNIDDVDTMVGLFAETPPPGFGFSDTAFRIFILMASRRLQSDRFLTVDFRPEIYSPFGMDWIANSGMTSVILRHCPDLASVLPRDASAFAPWRPAVPPPPSA
jgi:Animal haem peroxidase